MLLAVYRPCLHASSQYHTLIFTGVTVDCGNPGDIANGFKTFSDGTLLHSTVTYFCNVGYVRRGSSSRQCAQNGYWTGTTPKCVRGN